LEAAEELGLATARMYEGALGQFSGITSDLPKGPTAFNLLSWLKAHAHKLPSFVGGAIDYGALAGATNYVKMLAHRGCTHSESVQKEKFARPSDLGTTSLGLRKSIWNCMSSFWVDFGRVEAWRMADDR
jgi:hypothetical protein